MSACFVCDRPPHSPAGHDYLSVDAAQAWFDAQPDATPPPLVIDGEVISYAT